MALEADLSLRSATEVDEPFLRRLYASTRAEELAAFGWGEHEQQAFLDQQYAARAVDHRRRFADADDLVVELRGVPVGRLLVARAEGNETHVVDIALLPEHRGLGLGGRLLRWVLESTAGAVTLHVLAWSPARRLYERLGFCVVDDGEVYVTMRRPAAAVS